MTVETRKALKPNTKLLVIVNSNTRLEIIIGEVIAVGGSCIAYEGELVLNDNRPVIIKECYPSSIAISRDEKTNELLPENPIDFENSKNLFRKGITRASRLFSEVLIKDIFVYGECVETKTVYGISLKGDGSTLAELVKKEDLSIHRIAGIMISLCDMLAVVHKKHFIYLDTKPENIYCDKNDNVQLFDFDTVIADSEANNRLRSISYSMGWAAPEQLPSEKLNTRKISTLTDVFSVGAVFYWLLSGEKPYEFSNYQKTESISRNNEQVIEEKNSLSNNTTIATDFSTLALIENGSFDYREKFNLCKHVDKIVLKKVEEIIRGTLAYEPNNRAFRSINDLKDGFVSLWRETSVEKRDQRNLPSKKQNINRFNYDSELVDFFGRKAEMNLLVSMCENEYDFCWMGISGEAGSGKTRLAYELCKKMDKMEWQVFWPCHAKSNVNRIERYLDNICRDTLICFDDATTSSEEIIRLVNVCTETLSYNNCKIRVLLIDRDVDEIVSLFSEIESYLYKSTINRGIINLFQLTSVDAKKIITTYAKKMYNDELSEELVEALLEGVKETWEVYNPLFIQFSIDAFCQSGKINNWDRNSALYYLQKREFERIKSVVSEAVWERPLREKIFVEIQRVILFASFFDGLDINEIDNELYDKDTLIWVLNKCSLYDEKSKIVKSIKPDLFAEYLCYSIIKSLSINQIEAIFRIMINKNFDGFLKYGRNILDDYFDITDPNRALGVVDFISNEWNYCHLESLVRTFSDEELEDYIDYRVNDNKEKFFAWAFSHWPQYKSATLEAYKEIKQLVSSHLDEMFFCGEKDEDDGRYIGEYVFVWRCGNGECLYHNGDKYTGSWYEDKPNGKGKLEKVNGPVLTGVFRDGKLFSEGRIVFPDNTIIESAFWNNGKTNKGICCFADGRKYEGEIIPNLPIPNGHGLMTFEDGTSREGLWINGKPVDRIEEYLLPNKTIEDCIVNVDNLSTLFLYKEYLNSCLPSTSIHFLKNWGIPDFFKIINDPTGQYKQYHDIESLLADGLGCIQKD